MSSTYHQIDTPYYTVDTYETELSGGLESVQYLNFWHQKGLLIHFRSLTEIIYRANKNWAHLKKIKYFKIICIKKKLEKKVLLLD